MEQLPGPEEPLESRCFGQWCEKMMFLVLTQGIFTPPSVQYIVLKKNLGYEAPFFYLFALKGIETKPSLPLYFLRSVNVHH